MPFDEEYGLDPVPSPQPPTVDYDGETHLADLYAGLDRWRDGMRFDNIDERRAEACGIVEDGTYTADDIYRFCREADLEKEEGQYISYAINALDAGRVHLPDMGEVSHVGERTEDTDIVVHGDVGLFCGREMRGGSIRVKGDAGAGVAAGMEAGCVEVAGDVVQTGAVGHEMVGGAVILGGDYDLMQPYREAEVYERAENGGLRQVWPPR